MTGLTSDWLLDVTPHVEHTVPGTIVLDGTKLFEATFSFEYTPRWVYDDGGRSKYFKGRAGDCVVRAITIATGLDYKEVYDALNIARANPGRVSEKTRRMLLANTSSRQGHSKRTYDRFIKEELGWTWVPTKIPGQPGAVHLLREELPSGRLICRCSKHLVAVIDGVIHDTHDSSVSRTHGQGKRMVYGYYIDER